jgi:hypothetical protein
MSEHFVENKREQDVELEAWRHHIHGWLLA